MARAKVMKNGPPAPWPTAHFNGPIWGNRYLEPPTTTKDLRYLHIHLQTHYLHIAPKKYTCMWSFTCASLVTPSSPCCWSFGRVLISQPTKGWKHREIARANNTTTPQVPLNDAQVTSRTKTGVRVSRPYHASGIVVCTIPPLKQQPLLWHWFVVCPKEA